MKFWQPTPEQLDKFWQLVLEREAVTEKERMAIIDELEVKEVSIDELKQMVKGKKVLHIRKPK